jgi:hypothetical protein
MLNGDYSLGLAFAEPRCKYAKPRRVHAESLCTVNRMPLHACKSLLRVRRKPLGVRNDLLNACRGLCSVNRMSLHARKDSPDVRNEALRTRNGSL